MFKLYFIFILCATFISCTRNIYPHEEYIDFKTTENRIFVKLKVNKYKQGNFCFDTGADRFIIDSTFYKKQQMTFNNYSENQTKGIGNVIVRTVQVQDTIHFSVNNQSLFSHQNLIHNLKKSLGKNIDGIFGFASLRNIPFKVDYISKKIILNPKIDNTYKQINIKFDGNSMYLPVKLTLVNGASLKGDFVIDTGSRESSLTSEFAYNEDIINNKKSNYKNNGGIGGIHSGFSFFAFQLQIDNFKLTDHKIHVSKDSIGALSKNAKDIGIIGNDILDDFDIIFHPTRYKIWVRPNKNFNKPSDNLFKPFILIETENKYDGWLVGSIYEESDAYHKGLRHGDEIIEVNNKSVKRLNLEKFNQKLKPNQRKKLKVKRGDGYIEIDTYINVFLKKND